MIRKLLDRRQRHRDEEQVGLGRPRVQDLPLRLLGRGPALPRPRERRKVHGDQAGQQAVDGAELRG